MLDLEGQNEEMITLTADIVCAYVQKNVVPQSALTDLISSVHGALAGLGHTPEAPAAFVAEPAVPVKKSVKPEAISCLECGKSFKSIRRHLNASHSLTPEEYREKWSLPVSYPMTAPAYAEERSRLAKEMGLGQKAGAKAKGRKKAA